MATSIGNPSAQQGAMQVLHPRKLRDLQFHPFAEIFPLLEGKAFEEMVADMVDHGVREPIWIYEGKILDGRNRCRAAIEAWVPCRVRPYEGDDPLGFVVSLNLRRRHLSESQRAMIAAGLATMRQGERTDLKPSADLRKVAQADAAALLNISPRTVASAAWHDHGIPDRWAEKVDRRIHPHAKPASLIARLIGAVTQPGDLVVDPAAGGFTVMQAAHDLGRRFVSCDIAYGGL